MAHSSHPDPAVLDALAHWKSKVLFTVALVAAINLSLWFLPGIAGHVPAVWSRMMANTAIGVLFAVAGFYLSGERMSSRLQQLGHAFSLMTLLLGIFTLLEWADKLPFSIDSLFPSNDAQMHPGRPSVQSAMALTIVGTELLIVRYYKGRVALVADMLVVALIILVFLMTGAYLFGALELLHTDASAVMSPQTVFCFAGIAFCIAGRRAANGGIDSILVEIGIAGRAVRSAIPFAIALPFIAFGLVAYLINSGTMPAPFLHSLMATAEAFISLAAVIWMAWHIHDLESELRAQALTDNLTSVHNQRGFSLLGEQALREARRSKTYLTVYFFDLDGLKVINDTLGHETGSRMIQKMGELLRVHFRDSDVVARVGGDEFAVIIRGDGAAPALFRLHDAVKVENKSREARYQLHYSVGQATFDPASEEPFERLIARADSNMYENKIIRRRSKGSNGSFNKPEGNTPVPVAAVANVEWPND